MGSEIVLHDNVRDWLLALRAQDRDSARLVAAALDKLADEGPTRGRSLVDRVKGSGHHNMKELRPGSAGRSEVRILFAFDPSRAAILLVAGDKSGDWQGWYRKNIPVADRRYDEHLKNREGGRR